MMKKGILRLGIIFLLSQAFILKSEEKQNHYIPGGANDMSLSELKSAKITMLTHVPYEKNFLNAANKKGIKIMPYVDLEKVVVSSGDPVLLRNPFWRAIDADSNKHPEWLCIMANGEVKRPFNNPRYHPGFEQTCNNHKSLFDAQMKGIDEMMKLGCGGVFIDNAVPSHECFGEKLGIHKHDDPSKSNRECFEEAIRAAYKKIKSYGEDKMCAINSGFSRDQKERCDFTMVESIVYSCEHSKENKNSMDRKHWRSSILFWQNLKSDRANFALLQKDTPRISFSYLMDSCSDDEAAFFSFVYTKLLGIKLWSASPNRWTGCFSNMLARRDSIRLLYRVHDLGKPISKIFFNNDYAWRCFENATLALNASDKEIKLDLPIERLQAPLAELFSGKELSIKDGSVQLLMPPQTGRVIMSRKDVLENYLEEAFIEAKTARDYVKHEIEIKNKEFYDPSAIKNLDLTVVKLKEILNSLRSGKPLSQEAMDSMTFDAANISIDKIMKENANKIIDDAKSLTPEKIKDLFELPEDKPAIEIFYGGANRNVIKPAIRSAKSAFMPFHYRPDAFLNLGEDQYFDLERGPINSFGSSGETFVNWRNKKIATLLIKRPKDVKMKDYYLVPFGFEEIEKISGEKNVESYSAICYLAGLRSKQKVDAYKLKMNFSVRKGLPFLNLDFILLDKEQKKVEDANFILKFNCTKGYVSSKDGSKVEKKSQKAQWAYFVAGKEDKMGIIALGKPNLNLFAAGIRSNGSLKCALAALSAREYYFLKERIRNLKLYTGKAAALFNNVYLSIDSASEFSKQTQNPVCLKIANKSGKKIKSLKWSLNGEAAARKVDKVVPLKIQKTKSDGAENSAEYLVKIPDSFLENDLAYLLAQAEVELDNGNKFIVEAFISRRAKEALQIGSFNICAPAGKCRVKAQLKLKSFLARESKGKAVFSVSDPNVKVTPESMDFSIPSHGETILKYEISAPENMENKEANGVIKILWENSQEKEIKAAIKFSPSINIPHEKDAPKIDGKLDDKIWKKIGFNAKDFLYFCNDRKINDQTEVSAFWTEKSLFVGFKCYTKDMSKLLENALPDNNGYSPSALKNDSVEVYIRPLPIKRGAFYLRVGANSKGVKRNDQFVDISLINAGIYSKEKNTWRVKTSKHSDRWEMEMEIPFSVIGYKPEKGKVWGINFCRNQPRGEGATTWSCTYGPYAKPNFFGWGLFE
jgi:hypothetical protein